MGELDLCWESIDRFGIFAAPLPPPPVTLGHRFGDFTAYVHIARNKLKSLPLDTSALNPTTLGSCQESMF
jgi:hypothetical protein